MLVDSAPVLEGKGDVPIAAAVEKPVLMLLRQASPGLLQVDIQCSCHALKDVPSPLAHAPDRTDERNGPIPKAQVWRGDEQLLVMRIGESDIRVAGIDPELTLAAGATVEVSTPPDNLHIFAGASGAAIR